MEKQKSSTGRRKKAITRVYVNRGNGSITVNGKDYKTYFSEKYLQDQVELPLKTLESLDKFDVVVNAQGGGVKGQAEALKLGIARALIGVNPEYKPALKEAGLLTRDSREVERKKPGLRKARKNSQFSKR